MEKIQSAVTLFRSKYDALPGDLNNTVASRYGFNSRGGKGQGDGNELIAGSQSSSAHGFLQDGETTEFWVDLTVGNTVTPINVNLIEGTFQSVDTFSTPTVTETNASLYYPQAKLGGGNSIYVYSTQGINYYGMAPVLTIGCTPQTFTANMLILQAQKMDAKLDDGLPMGGKIRATWISDNPSTNTNAPYVNGANPITSTSCFDSTANSYAVSAVTSNGNNPNCALSFQFK